VTAARRSVPIDPMELARKARGGERLLGVLVRMPNEMLVELAGLAGFDYVVIDAEHGPSDQVALGHHISTAESMGVPLIVRIGAISEVLRVLDLGAAGIICPHVDSVAQAEALVDAVHYPPRGRRGFAAYSRAAHYGLSSDVAHLTHYRDGPLVIAMIESRAGLAAAADIAAVEGIDLVFPGPADLGVDLGILGEGQAEVDRAIQAVRTVTDGRILNICGDEVTAAAHFAAGSRLVVYNTQHAVSQLMVRLVTALPHRSVHEG